VLSDALNTDTPVIDEVVKTAAMNSPSLENYTFSKEESIEHYSILPQKYSKSFVISLSIIINEQIFRFERVLPTATKYG
jgi:hypothetical protein